MKCPGCSTEVEEGISICPRCDYIIDDSFLSESPGPGRDREERALGGGGVRPRSTSPTPATTRYRAPSSSSQRAATASPSKRPAPLESDDDDDATIGTYSGPVRLPPESPDMMDPQVALAEVFRRVKALEGTDKLALAGVLLTFLFSFLPWKETAMEGEVLGLMSSGVWVVLASLLSMGAMTLRVGQMLPQVPAKVLWRVQALACGFALLYCLVFVKLSWNPTQVQALVGNVIIATSKPSLGVFLALCSTVLALVGTVMGLRQSDTTPRDWP